MKRKAYDKLLEWKNSEDKMPLMVLGVRQCGKTYIIDEFCKNEYKNYIQVNLFERIDVVELYRTNKPSDEKYNELSIMLSMTLEDEDTILFIDEIQESEELIQELKYFCEKHPKMNIIVAGSLLGVKLGRLHKSFPVGKVSLMYMFPMDFEEFLIATGNERFIPEIKNCYENNKEILNSFHDSLLKLYRTYQFIGGMPRCVQKYIDSDGDYFKYDSTILNDIISEYLADFRKHTENKADALKIEELYKSIPSQLNNQSNKFQYSKIKKGSRAKDYDVLIDWLEDANLINISYKVSMPEIPLEGFKNREVFKLFMSDTGILSNMLDINLSDAILDKLSLYKGPIAENYVANELLCNNHKLYYWNSSGDAEIDFLLYNSDGIIPVEVKAGDNTQSKSLKVYMDKYNPNYAIRISTKNFGYNPVAKIKSVPLYAVFCIK